MRSHPASALCSTSPTSSLHSRFSHPLSASAWGQGGCEQWHVRRRERSQSRGGRCEAQATNAVGYVGEHTQTSRSSHSRNAWHRLHTTPTQPLETKASSAHARGCQKERREPHLARAVKREALAQRVVGACTLPPEWHVLQHLQHPAIGEWQHVIPHTGTPPLSWCQRAAATCTAPTAQTVPSCSCALCGASPPSTLTLRPPET